MWMNLGYLPQTRPFLATWAFGNEFLLHLWLGVYSLTLLPFVIHVHVCCVSSHSISPGCDVLTFDDLLL